MEMKRIRKCNKQNLVKTKSVWGGVVGVAWSKDQSCPEWPKIHFGFGILEI